MGGDEEGLKRRSEPSQEVTKNRATAAGKDDDMPGGGVTP